MKLTGGNGKKKAEKNPAPKKTKSAAPKAEKKTAAAQAPAAKPKKKAAGLTPAKIGLIIAAVVVALLFAAAAGGVYYVSTIDEIYPNVTLDGHELGGMSATEAAAKLDELGYSSQEGEEVNVYLPLDVSLNVKASEVCSETPIADLVQRVYEATSGGSAVSDAISYIKCRFGGMALESEILITVDADAVAAKVDNIVRELNLRLMESGVEIGEESIAVTKGASGVTVDADEITALIVAAFEAGDYSDIVYEAQIHADEELDLEKLHSTVFCEPADAYYDKESGEVVEEVVGMDFDKDAAAALWAEAGYGEVVEIPLIITEPEVTAEYLESVLFRDMLSSSKTSLWGSSSSRINNVTKACESVNGIILMPGETFSYNEALGERTAANGYLPAGAYSGGQTVQEYGGGICQVSSMMYYCALYANLQISTRMCHYFPVTYLPPGLDATVSWGGPEFKFVNNREYPIKVVAYVTDDNNVIMEYWGTDTDGSYVVMTYSTWLVYDEEYEDVAIGYKAQTYRSVYDKDGNLISSKAEALSFYNYHEEDIEWPEESPEPTPTPTPTPAPETTPTPDVEPTPEMPDPDVGTSPPPDAEIPTPPVTDPVDQ